MNIFIEQREKKHILVRAFKRRRKGKKVILPSDAVSQIKHRRQQREDLKKKNEEAKGLRQILWRLHDV